MEAGSTTKLLADFVQKISDADTENELKETFPVFSKYNEDRITAEEVKLVLTHLLGKVENI